MDTSIPRMVALLDFGMNIFQRGNGGDEPLFKDVILLHVDKFDQQGKRVLI